MVEPPPPEVAKHIRGFAGALQKRLPQYQIPKFRKGRVTVLNGDGTVDIVIPPVPDPGDNSGQSYPRIHTLGSYTVRTIGDYVWFCDLGHGQYICLGPENFQPPDEPPPEETPTPTNEFPGFSATGTSAVGDVAAIWEASLPHTYTAALISCVLYGGATYDFDIEVNGSVVTTVSLTTGETRHIYAGFSVAAGDRIGGTVTAEGGQIAVSVQLLETA